MIGRRDRISKMLQFDGRCSTTNKRFARLGIHCVRRIAVKPTIKNHLRIHQFLDSCYPTQLWRLYVDVIYRLQSSVSEPLIRKRKQKA